MCCAIDLDALSAICKNISGTGLMSDFIQIVDKAHGQLNDILNNSELPAKSFVCIIFLVGYFYAWHNLELILISFEIIFALRGVIWRLC